MTIHDCIKLIIVSSPNTVEDNIYIGIRKAEFLSYSHFQYTPNHNEFDTYFVLCVFILKIIICDKIVKVLSIFKHLNLMVEQSRALDLDFKDHRAWVRIPLETYIFILKFLLPSCSSQLRVPVQMKSCMIFIKSNMCVVRKIV